MVTGSPKSLVAKSKLHQGRIVFIIAFINGLRRSRASANYSQLKYPGWTSSNLVLSVSKEKFNDLTKTELIEVLKEFLGIGAPSIKATLEGVVSRYPNEHTTKWH